MAARKEGSDLGRALAALRKNPGNHKLKACSKCGDLRSCDTCQLREKKRVCAGKVASHI
jgi:hypothetical protein